LKKEDFMFIGLDSNSPLPRTRGLKFGCQHYSPCWQIFLCFVDVLWRACRQQIVRRPHHWQFHVLH